MTGIPLQSFRGRTKDLNQLHEQLRIVAEGTGGTPGQALVVTGRRRVGKSRLVQELCDRSQLPYLVFQASRARNSNAERIDFTETIERSHFGNAELASGIEPKDWHQALRILAAALDEQTPAIVVLDEVPWLMEQDREFEGALQTVWDRHLAAKPVLLILIGSDLSMMESLQEYGRPFFGRAKQMTIRPMHAADVQEITQLSAGDAIDATLITGGFPEIVGTWDPGMNRTDYLSSALINPLSALLVSGELVLMSEFPQSSYTRTVLEVIGAGNRNFSAIASKSGGAKPVPSGTLTPILSTLVAKRVISADQPYSTKPEPKLKRYCVVDTYLQFWLAFLRRGITESERGRGDLVLNRIERSWASWRGRAVEPLIRESLMHLVPNEQWPDTENIGAWWNRHNNPELDLIGGDRTPVAKRIHCVGSIKWLETRPFQREDYNKLARDAQAVSGTDEHTPLVAVSRSGCEPRLPLAACWTPEDLLSAWQ